MPFQPHSPTSAFQPLVSSTYRPGSIAPQPQERAAAPAPAPERQEPQDQRANVRQLNREIKRRKALEEKVSALERELSTARDSSTKDSRFIEELTSSLESARSLALQQMRTSFADLILSYIKRLVKSAAPVNSAVFEGRMEEIMEHLVLEGGVSVAVPPHRPELAERLISGREGWRVEPDPTLTEGCRAECRSGVVDASIEAAFSSLEGGVREWLLLAGGADA